jgi:hypothetical protein
MPLSTLSTATRLGPREILTPLGSFGMVVVFATVGAFATLRAQQPAPDLILSNGKIITVDERFTIAQAVAIRGDRIVAAGAIRRWPSLRGRTPEGST